MAGWLDEVFGISKPVIVMTHFPVLDVRLGVDGIRDKVEQDVQRLLDAGVDVTMFCNEDDRPYAFHAGLETVAVMTKVITEMRSKDRPFGVDSLWDARAPLAGVDVPGASFVREVVMGVYESDPASSYLSAQSADGGLN